MAAEEAGGSAWSIFLAGRSAVSELSYISLRESQRIFDLFDASAHAVVVYRAIDIAGRKLGLDPARDDRRRAAIMVTDHLARFRFSVGRWDHSSTLRCLGNDVLPEGE